MSFQTEQWRHKGRYSPRHEMKFYDLTKIKIISKKNRKVVHADFSLTREYELSLYFSPIRGKNYNKTTIRKVIVSFKISFCLDCHQKENQIIRKLLSNLNDTVLTRQNMSRSKFTYLLNDMGFIKLTKNQQID